MTVARDSHIYEQVKPVGNVAAANGKLSVNVGNTSTLIAVANADRRALMLINYSDTLIWVCLHATAEVTMGIPLAPRVDANNPGGQVTIEEYAGIVTAIHAGAGNKQLVGVEV